MRQVAVITGGGRGIGRATALRLARDGAAVVIGYRSDAKSAEATAEAARRLGSEALAVRAEVTDPAQLTQLLDSAQEAYGGLDVVVHNAYGFVFGPVAGNSDQDFETTFGANSRATFELLRAAGSRLRDGGRFVLVSSGATRIAMPGTGLYGASKAAAEQLVRVAARELADRGITVNSILPGHTDTDGLRSAPVPLDDFRTQIPMGRLGEPEDIADAIALLVSRDARWITGQSIAVDGGLTA